MHAVGRHLLVDLRDCDKEVLDDMDFLKDTFLAAAKFSNDAVSGETFHRFEPQGVSGIVLTIGSHLGIHTWPEFGFAAIDIYTHDESLDLEEVAKFLIKKLKSKNPSIVELRRGLLP